MTLHYIWGGFFIIGFITAVVQYFIIGDSEVFKRMMDATFDASRMAVMDIALPLTGIMALWMGLMNIGEKAGAVRLLSRIVGPFFNRLFPEIPKSHSVSGQLLMNFSANMLGLDNAATPLGLKAMQSLQELNPDKEKASNAQIMFLTLNTSSLTIIPVSILAQRVILGASNPADVFIPILIATFCSTLAGLFYVAIRQKISLFNKVVIGWIGGIAILIAAAVWYLSSLPKSEMEATASLWSNGILITIIVGFIIGGMYKKINIFDSFVEGAKGGFETSIRIIPYLVAMLTGIAIFRAAGSLDIIMNGIRGAFSLFQINTDFVEALPTALMKPLSGSGAKAMMIETMQTYGPDSFAGRLSCLFQGAADTTFYIIALYFGSVGIKNIRYSVSAGLIADIAGVIAGIIVAYFFFH